MKEIQVESKQKEDGNQGQAGEVPCEKPSQPTSFGFLKLFGPRYWKATALACGIQVTQQWSGINAIMFYSGQMFVRAQVPANMIQYAVCATGLFNVVITIISVRFLLFISLLNNPNFTPIKFLIYNTNFIKIFIFIGSGSRSHG